MRLLLLSFQIDHSAVALLTSSQKPSKIAKRLLTKDITFDGSTFAENAVNPTMSANMILTPEWRCDRLLRFCHETASPLVKSSSTMQEGRRFSRSRFCRFSDLKRHTKLKSEVC